jgi:1-deoxy-D-xylulose-5-phosphate reductoisomerase
MLEQVTLEQALKHPNWTMGAKVTIDSATLMNKGLEFLEAMALFQMPPEKISVLVHRESIVHSLVEYCDNAVLAQLGTPDMRLPIQYALTWPKRTPGAATALDLLSCKPLTFASPDMESFPCLALALQAAKKGGTMPAILNGANEVAVARFLGGEINFLGIPRLVERTMERVASTDVLSLDAVFQADAEARLVASGEPARDLR